MLDLAIEGLGQRLRGRLVRTTDPDYDEAPRALQRHDRQAAAG